MNIDITKLVVELNDFVAKLRIIPMMLFLKGLSSSMQSMMSM
jgi:hypothetical protein